MTSIEYGLIATISIVAIVVGVDLVGVELTTILDQVSCGIQSADVCVLSNKEVE